MQQRILISFLFIFFSCASVLACEPCGETWNLDQSLEEADIVIIGQKVFEGPHAGGGRHTNAGGPDWIMVKIKEVLKGDVDQTKDIKVNSWDGMCNYGVAVDERDYVMILKKASIEERMTFPEEYYALNAGCSVKALLIEEEMAIEYTVTIPLEELKSKLR